VEPTSVVRVAFVAIRESHAPAFDMSPPSVAFERLTDVSAPSIFKTPTCAVDMASVSASILCTFSTACWAARNCGEAVS
jgi:hypothetical protein